ncbi:MAG: hypothetical protein U0175_01340 [Caldilineaceae bacterium]
MNKTPSTSLARTVDLLEQATGVVIPTYFHAETDPQFAEDLLASTVQLFVREVADAQHICISADGPGLAAQVAERVASRYQTRWLASEKNGGKLSSLRNGMRELLEKSDVHYLTAVDHDGDHFANELLNFVRAAEHVTNYTGNERVIVLGNRISLHRPLGFLRAEQEELADRMLLDALHYNAAICGRPLALQFATTIHEVPDFHSGYKLFSRPTSEAIFLSEPNLAGCSEVAYFRHAIEAVMIVEALEDGALLATVNRSTFDEQPISTFARMDRSQLTANLIIWPCKRLKIPAPFVAQWLANHLPKLLLGTLAPQGRAELLAIRNVVLQAFDLVLPEDEAALITRAEFV